MLLHCKESRIDSYRETDSQKKRVASLVFTKCLLRSSLLWRSGQSISYGALTAVNWRNPSPELAWGLTAIVLTLRTEKQKDQLESEAILQNETLSQNKYKNIKTTKDLNNS